MSRVFCFVVVLVVMAILFGCASSGGQLDGGHPLPIGSWALSALEGEPLPAGVRPPTLTIADDGTVSGHAGVNRFSGSVDPGVWADGGLVFGPLAVTRMAGPPEAMAVESRFLGSLDAVRTFATGADALTLLGDSGEVLLFRRSD